MPDQTNLTPSKAAPLKAHFLGTATEAGTRSILRDITGWLGQSEQAADQISTVEMVLAEAINNIVEHAYADAAEAKWLRAELSLCDRQLNVALCDSGQAFPNGTLPNGDLPDLEVALDALPEGGFGWYLIYAQTKSVQYARTNGENILSLCFELDRN